MRTALYEPIMLLQKQSNKTMYLVKHQISNKLYVMKRLAQSTDLTMYEQLSQNPHPYMANVTECGKDDSYSYVIEEYVNGTTLEYEMSTGQLTYEDKIRIMLDLFAVLEHLHALNPPVIHRDIKPANIMIKDSHVKLIDFEIARNVAADKNKDTQIMGSVGYAPPEQFGFAQTDQRSDIYALGVIIKELFTEKKAVYAYRFLIEKCMKMDPKERYFSVKQLHHEFIRCSKGKRISHTNRLQRFRSYQLVGFRNESIWVKALVFIYTIIAIQIAFAVKFENPDTTMLSLIQLRVCIFFIVMLMIWIPTDSFHLLEITPLYRSSSRIIRFCNGCIIWFCVSCVLIFAICMLAALMDQLLV